MLAVYLYGFLVMTTELSDDVEMSEAESENMSTELPPGGWVTLLWSLSSSSSSSSSSLRNISLYPPCALDSDCSADHACMQYMCYPWDTSTGFRWCSKQQDCQDLTLAEEGDGRDGLCFRHPDTERIQFGICLKKM